MITMRSLFAFFRPQKLALDGSVMAPQDQAKLEVFRIQAEVETINKLMTTEPVKAQESVEIMHRAYWNHKESVERTESELRDHYQSFFKDNRAQTTFFGGFASCIMSYLLDSQMSSQYIDGCPNNEAMFSTLSKTLAILTMMTALQLFHRLNFQEEARELNSRIQDHSKEAEYYKAILIQTNNEALLEKAPQVPENTFAAR